MPLPETETLTSYVSQIFQIEDFTLGDPRQWVVRYRGKLLSDDSVAAYDQLAESVQQHNLTPLFRIENDQQVIYLVYSIPPPRPTRISVNILLFVLTVLSVMLAGAQPEGPIPQEALGQIISMGKAIITGAPFALSLLGILLAHEFGHYLISRYHNTPATLPYFIPFPFSPLGTMGAVIFMQGIPKNKRVLFDIGVAGPLAGLLVAIPVLFYGLQLSTLNIIEATPNMFLEGNSILYLFAKYITFGKLLPEPVAGGGAFYWLQYFFTGTPMPIGGLDVFIHPIAFAGWAGLLVTALNLIPVGSLDGGHVVYALFGEKAKKAYPYAIGVLIILGFFSSSWWLWAAILYFLGRSHAQPYDQITELDNPRRTIALIVLILFILTFTPVTFAVYVP